MAINKLGGPGGFDRTDSLGSGNSGSARRTADADSRPEDRVELSPAAKSAVRLADLARELPEIRQERVLALREQIDAGEYTVDARQLARAILDLEDDLER